MSYVFVNVAPVFVLILAGWLSAKAKVLTQDAGNALGEFVFRIAVPLLIFRTLAEAEFSGVSPFRLWASYFIGVAMTWTVAHLVATRLFKRDAKGGVVAGMSSSFANNIFIGLPVVGHVVGKEGLVALSILIAIHLPFMMVVGTVLMENAAAGLEDRPRRGLGLILRQIGISLLRNPLVMALAAGTAFNFSGLQVTPVLEVVIGQLAAAASPVALISIGIALTRYRIRGDIGLCGTVTAFKLMLMPAAVFASSHLLGLPRDFAAALVLTSSLPTGINTWLIAQRFRSGEDLSASVITLTTAFGVLTVSLWAWLLT